MPALELRRVSKRYPSAGGELTVLRSVDLVIGRGEHAAIVGPSGSGKSTLLSILGTLDSPSDGEVLVGGRSTAQMADDERSAVRSSQLGFVFQQFHLLAHVDAVANVELGMLYSGLGRVERRRRAVEALTRVGLSARLDHRPTQLSGGEQQRVAIARAIAPDPVVLLADEPTGALDQATGVQIIDLLRGLDDVALVVITHDPQIAEGFGRRIRIRDGCIEADSRWPGESTEGGSSTSGTRPAAGSED
ncbi:ABC transporter ATP-binding protein [Promicromonospora vindobonensis]|uniref:ABC transporter ATP-binding protein n=1 Tax=Promicromonospora vindobonensis TaxID=195748 RepID=A0ABW5VN14_9MICO